MAINVQNLFNQDLPARIAADKARFGQIGRTFQLCIDGEGDWLVDATPANPRVQPGTHPADATFTMRPDTFQKYMENPQANGMQLYFAGQLKITGNPMLLNDLPKALYG